MSEETLDPELLEQLAAPLRTEVDKLKAELLEVDQQREVIQVKLRRLQGAYDKLIPPPPKPKKLSKSENRTREQRIQEVQKFLETSNGTVVGGFNSTQLWREMTKDGASLIGKEGVRTAVIELQDRGIVRLDRKGVGGSNIYKLVADTVLAP